MDITRAPSEGIIALMTSTTAAVQCAAYRELFFFWREKGAKEKERNGRGSLSANSTAFSTSALLKPLEDMMLEECIKFTFV